MPTVTFHGVRGSCPCSDPRMSRYGGGTSCVSIQPDDDVPPIVLDLGTGSRLLGEDLVARYLPGRSLSRGMPPDDLPDPLDAAVGEPAGAVSANEHMHHGADAGSALLELSAFVTHLHFDHVQGLPFFGPAIRQGTLLTIYGPSKDATTLEHSFAAFVRPPYFPVGLDDLPSLLRWRAVSDGDSIRVGDAVVLAREVPHRGPTLGYRVQCGGFVITYLSDHQAPRGSRPGGGPGEEGGPRLSEAVCELAADADLLIHDAQYTDEEFAVKGHWGHSTVGFALEVARASGAKRLALFHHDPTHDDEWLDGMEAEATRLAAGDFAVVMAAEGFSIKLQ